ASIFKSKASVGDALPVDQGCRLKWLPPTYEVAFDHDGLKRGLSGKTLLEHGIDHRELSLRILVAVPVAAIDHDRFRQPRGAQTRSCTSDVFASEVGPRPRSTAQHQVRIGIPRGLEDRRPA